MQVEQIIVRRDANVVPHLEQYAPVWLVSENLVPEDDSVVFDVVFQHNLYGWVRRRYRYDAFTDILYYLGQNVLPENEVLEIQEQQEPYVIPLLADITHSYGG